jgi:hypothetical protein
MADPAPCRRRLLTGAFPLPAIDPGRHLLTTMPVRLWRFDAAAFPDWSWAPFARPRHRFDSAAGLHRVRYAATSALGAARERYRDTGMYIPADHVDHHVAELTGTLTVLDLRDERVLDAFGVDDRISTGREPAVWQWCQALVDLVLGWWDGHVHAVVYRPRTTPQSSTNVAILAGAPLTGTSTRLADHRALLDQLVIVGGGTLGF